MYTTIWGKEEPGLYMSIKIYTAQCGLVVSTTTTSYKRFSETPNSLPIKQNRKQNLSHISLLEKEKKIDTQINRNERTGSTKSKSKKHFFWTIFFQLFTPGGLNASFFSSSSFILAHSLDMYVYTKERWNGTTMKLSSLSYLTTTTTTTVSNSKKRSWL